jgi:chaperonin GroES
MKFRPLHDWILIKRSKPVEMTGSGIIIPDTARDKPAEGIVEAVGPGRYKQEKGKKDKKFFPTVLKPGQKVIFIDYMAKDVELDAKEITLIREDDVLGIIEHKGELTVKNAYPVEIKKDRPPMVQARPEKTEAAVGVKPPAKTKRKKQAEAEVKTTAAKSPKKGKEGTMKKTVKKAAPAKKTTAKKTAKKAAPKKAAPKKTVAKKSVKKATVKKAVAKKAAPKKTAKKTTKKTKK